MCNDPPSRNVAAHKLVVTDACRELAEPGDGADIPWTCKDNPVGDGGSKVAHGSRKRAHNPPPEINPQAGICSYYLTGKHRFCRTECRSGSRFCPTHSLTPAALIDGVLRPPPPPPLTGTEVGGDDATATSECGRRHGKTRSLQRIPCPLNPNHSVYADRLNKHLRVCPDLRFVTNTLPFYVKDKHANRGGTMCSLKADAQRARTCEGQVALSTPHFVAQAECTVPSCGETEEQQVGGGVDASCTTRRWTHHDLTPSHLRSLIARVESCYAQHIAPRLLRLDPTAVARVTRLMHADDGCSTTTATHEAVGRVQRSQKHGPQHDALLYCLNEAICSAVTHGTAIDAHPVLPSSLLVASRTDTSGQLDPATLRVHAFLELGAGKGGLAVALQRLLLRYTQGDEDSRIAMRKQLPFLTYVVPQPRLVVVDCDGFRRKGDACVSRSALPLQRLRIDIKDLYLARALADSLAPHTMSSACCNGPLQPPQSRQDGSGDAAQDERPADVVPAVPRQRAVAVLGKHLCGACTDFSLSCLTEPELDTVVEAGSGQRAGSVDVANVGIGVCACVLATCCHHRCELRHLNPLRRDVTDVCHDVSHTTTVTQARHEEQGQQAKDDAHVVGLPGTDFALTAREFAALTSMSSWAVSGAIVDAARRATGRCCKHVIDALRVAYLLQHGFTAHLIEYTSTDVTEENVCIVAWKAG